MRASAQHQEHFRHTQRSLGNPFAQVDSRLVLGQQILGESLITTTDTKWPIIHCSILRVELRSQSSNSKRLNFGTTYTSVKTNILYDGAPSTNLRDNKHPLLRTFSLSSCSLFWKYRTFNYEYYTFVIRACLPNYDNPI